jgi:hypothetical protein
VLLGKASFGDDNAVTEEVLRAMPPGQPESVKDVRTGLLDELRRLGNRATVQRMLEGGLRFVAGTGPAAREVKVTLEVSDPSRATNVSPGALPLWQISQRERLGQKEQGDPEASIELTAGTRQTSGNDRSLAGTANVALLFGHPPALARSPPAPTTPRRPRDPSNWTEHRRISISPTPC